MYTVKISIQLLISLKIIADGSFDIPDRSFHSMDITWKLASRESNTDFKEAIPEFYYLPEVLKNLQHFDFGKRQNGVRVHDVTLPPWAKGDARLFALINRQVGIFAVCCLQNFGYIRILTLVNNKTLQALESNQVRKYLNDWIDLIFGYKQTGKAAIQAMNVFHPSVKKHIQLH